jgi:threonine dehydrogenase-like Zn-dependent dehydrogenase
VSIEPGVPDFTCQYCRAGHYGLAGVEQALTAGALDPGSVKVVVTPQR